MGGGVQRLAVHLVGVITQPYHKQVWAHDRLNILGLLHLLQVCLSNGVRDELIPTVVIEPNGCFSLLTGLIEVAPLVQRVASCCGSVGGLIQVIRVL